MKKSLLYAVIYMLVSGSVLQAMTFDNHYLPLFFKPHIRHPEALSVFRMQPFFMRGERAFGDIEDSSIPDLDGRYDLVQLDQALTISGRAPGSLFRSDLQGIPSIPFKRDGKIEAEGIAFYYEQALGWSVSVGFDFFFMHVNARNEFIFDNSCLDVQEGDRNYLFNLNKEMDNLLGVTPPLFSKTGFSDFDFYFRFGSSWEYPFKFRRVDLGVKLGMIAPTGLARELDNPAAIPFGGNKHWGIYVDIHNDYELKEDWFFSWMLRGIKRFDRSSCARMPVAFEPTNYGAVVGQLEVDPNWTIVFNPTFTIGGLRDGLGVMAAYTLVHHFRDHWADERGDKTIPVNLERPIARSSWATDYVTIGAFYDFTKLKDEYATRPVFYAYWDVPVGWLTSERSVKTYAVSLMLEINF